MPDAAVLAPLLATLPALGAPFAVAGGDAAAAHGLDAPPGPRCVLAALRPNHAERLAAALAGAYALPADFAARLLARQPLPLVARAGGDTVLLVPAPETDYDRRALQRAPRLRVPGLAAAVPVLAFEDLVLWELRAAGRDALPAVVPALLRQRGNRFNHCYLLEWSEPLGVAGPLDEALLLVRG